MVQDGGICLSTKACGGGSCEGQGNSSAEYEVFAWTIATRSGRDGKKERQESNNIMYWSYIYTGTKYVRIVLQLFLGTKSVGRRD